MGTEVGGKGGRERERGERPQDATRYRCEVLGERNGNEHFKEAFCGLGSIITPLLAACQL